jgi:hypothetical protein
MVLGGRGTATLLDSYGEERGGEHRRLDDQQARGFQNSVYRGPVKDAAMDLAARFIPNIGTRIQGSADLQQLTVGYPGSSLSDDHLGSVRDLVRRHAPKAGERAPDAKTIAAEGTSTTLFAHLYNPDGWSWGWSLLAFDGRQADALPDLRRAIEKMKRWEWIRPRLVLGSAVAEKGEAMVLSDLDGEAHAAYGVDGTPALILVRPDGHIAFRGHADRLDRLTAYCAKIFSD